jgi:hypothetical protein
MSGLPSSIVEILFLCVSFQMGFADFKGANSCLSGLVAFEFRMFNVFILQGGMSNEMYNTIARVTDGIYEGKLFIMFLISYFFLFQI